MSERPETAFEYRRELPDPEFAASLNLLVTDLAYDPAQIAESWLGRSAP